MYQFSPLHKPRWTEQQCRLLCIQVNIAMRACSLRPFLATQFEGDFIYVSLCYLLSQGAVTYTKLICVLPLSSPSSSHCPLDDTGILCSSSWKHICSRFSVGGRRCKVEWRTRWFEEGILYWLGEVRIRVPTSKCKAGSEIFRSKIECGCCPSGCC